MANKKQFKLKEHLERLYAGIKILRIPIEMSIDEMFEACLETVRRNDPVFEDTDEHRLMINVSRGPLGVYAPIFDYNLEPTLVVADFPLKWTVSYMGNLYDEGINAVLVNQKAMPAYIMDPKIKNRSRVFYQMANIEASQFRGDNNWALLLDTDGFISEGTGDNFFIVKDNKVITPEGRNILRGISRDYVINELCKELNIEVIEKNIELYDVYDADEAFMTGTPFCMLPVTSINGLKISKGFVGPTFSKILKKWGENCDVNIANQIKSWNNPENLNSSAPTPYKFK